MARRTGRKKRRLTPINPTLPPPPTRKTLLQRLAAASGRAKILIATAFAAAPAAGWGWTQFSDTNLQIDPAAPSLRAFTIPFVLKNPSWWFTATDVEVECNDADIRIGNSNIRGNKIRSSFGSKYSIEPGGQRTIYCGVLTTSTDVDAVINLSGSYKTISIERSFGPKTFRWLRDAAPPRWIEDSADN